MNTVQEEVKSGTTADCLLTSENFLGPNAALGPHVAGWVESRISACQKTFDHTVGGAHLTPAF